MESRFTKSARFSKSGILGQSVKQQKKGLQKQAPLINQF